MAVVRTQIVAIRDAAKAIESMASAMLAALEGTELHRNGECSHPPELRRQAPRMGAPEAWVCECGAEGDRIHE